MAKAAPHVAGSYREARTATLNALAKLEPLLVLKEKLEQAEDAEAYVAEAEATRAKVEAEVASLKEVLRLEGEKLHAYEVRVSDRIKAMDQQLAERKALLTRQFQAAQADQATALAALESQVAEKRQAADARIAGFQAEVKAAQATVADLEARIAILKETEAALRKSIGG